MPHSRPMPLIEARCHELRIRDQDATWQIIYRIDRDAVIPAEVFSKKTQATGKGVIDVAKRSGSPVILRILSFVTTPLLFFS